MDSGRVGRHFQPGFGSAHHVDAAVCVRSDARGDGTPPGKRSLRYPRCSQHNEIDVVYACQFEQRAAGICAFDHMQRDPGRWKAERFHPLAKAHLVLEMPSGCGIQITRSAYRRRSHHGYAHQPQFRIDRKELPRCQLERRVALVLRMFGVDRHHDHRDALGRSTPGRREHPYTACAPPSPSLCHDAKGPCLIRAPAQRDLFRMTQEIGRASCRERV